MRRLPVLFLLIAALALGFVTPALAGTEDDEAIAADAVLTEDDVADYGLEEEEPADEPPPSGAVCRKVRAAIKAADRAPHAESSFDDDAGTTASSSVSIFKNQKAARATLAAYKGNKAARCLESAIEEEIQENGEPGSSYEFSGDVVDVDLGDESIVYQVKITLTGAEGDVTELYTEIGVIRVGRGIADLQFGAVGALFAGSEDLATTVVDRMTESLDV